MWLLWSCCSCTTWFLPILWAMHELNYFNSVLWKSLLHCQNLLICSTVCNDCEVRSCTHCMWLCRSSTFLHCREKAEASTWVLVLHQMCPDVIYFYHLNTAAIYCWIDVCGIYPLPAKFVSIEWTVGFYHILRYTVDMHMAVWCVCDLNDRIVQ